VTNTEDDEEGDEWPMV